MDPENPDVASDPSTDTKAEQATDTVTVKDDAPKDILSRMDERMTEVATDDTEDDTDPQATAKGKKADPKAKEEKAEDSKVEDKPEGEAKAKQKPDTIPMKAFEARVGKLTEQKRALQTDLSSANLEKAKLSAALSIASEELERYRALATEAGVVDDKDEQIRSHAVREKARQEKARVDEEHQTFTASFSEQETREANVQQLETEIGEALEAHDLVEREVLIALLRKPANLSRPVLDVAGEYQARVLKAAGVTGGATAAAAVVERRPFPKTAKARSNGNAAARRPANLDGMMSRLEELQRQNT